MRARWSIVPIGNAPIEIIDGDRGKNYPKQDEFFNSGYCLFLNAGNVTKYGFSFNNCQFITEAKDNTLRKGKLSKDDVVMTTRGTIGNVAAYCDSVLFEHMRINSGMVIFRCDKNCLSPLFLYLFLRSPDFIGQVNSLQSGVAQPQLPIRDIRRIKIPVPELKEQLAVVNILSAYDDLIENNRRRMQLLEQAARLFYKEWFVHLRFPGHEHVTKKNGVPEGWEEKKMEDVCDTVGGGTPSTTKPGYWENGDVTWVIPSDVTKNDCLALIDSEKKITQSGLRSSSARIVLPDTILMTSRASVGFFAMMDREVCTNQGFINIVPHKNWLRMYLLHNLMYRVEEIRSYAGGSTYKEISKGRFRQMAMMVPSKPIAQEFDDLAYRVLKQVRVLKKQQLKLMEARDLLLPRLMNGEIAV
jgi:type I restriction enzyme S subunit